jgi:hypothetical protein
MPIALQAIRWGDRDLYGAADWVDNAPIWVHFQSNQNDWKRLVQYGSFNEHQLME